MPISLKATVGGGGDPVNSIKEMYLDDILYTTAQGQKWLRSGWVETDVSSYPDAKRTTVALDMSNSGITYSGSANIAQIDSFNGGARHNATFTISSDRTKAAIPCGTTAENLNRFVLFTTNGGSTWSTTTLTAETTHEYTNGALGTTKAMFIGFDITSNTANSKYIKTNTSFASPTAPVSITMGDAAYVCFTGTNFLIASQSGKLARVPDATDTITYLSDAPTPNVELLMSPSNGVVLYADNSGGRSRIYRSTDEGSTWTNVLDLNTVSSITRRINSIYVDGSTLYCTVGGQLIPSSNNTMEIYVSTNGGVSWVNIPYSFTWDGILYDSNIGWPSSVGPSTSSNPSYNSLFRDSPTTLRIPLYFNSTKFCYLQSADNGVSWTTTKPATRSVWAEFIAKSADQGGNDWHTAQLSNGVFAVAADMKSPDTNPIYKFQGSTTFVGIPEVYSATGQVGTTSVGTATSSASKYVRVL